MRSGHLGRARDGPDTARAKDSFHEEKEVSFLRKDQRAYCKIFSMSFCKLLNI
jgi:hypothetical protein